MSGLARKRMVCVACVSAAVICVVAMLVLGVVWYESIRVHDGPVPGLHAWIVTYRRWMAVPNGIGDAIAYDCSTGRTVKLPFSDQNDLARRLSPRDRAQSNRWGFRSVTDEWKLVGSPVWENGRLTIDRYRNGRLDGRVTLGVRVSAAGEHALWFTDVAPYGYCAVVMPKGSAHVCLFDRDGRLVKELGPGIRPIFSARDRLLSYIELDPSAVGDAQVTGNIIVYDLDTKQQRSVYVGADPCGCVWDRGHLVCERGSDEALYVVDISRSTPRWYSTPLTGGRQIVWFMVGRMPKP